MVVGETLHITLTKGILGHVPQISPDRISKCIYIYIFRTIKEFLSWWYLNCAIYIYIYSLSVHLWNMTENSLCKCYLQFFTYHHHLPPLSSSKESCLPLKLSVIEDGLRVETGVTIKMFPLESARHLAWIPAGEGVSLAEIRFPSNLFAQARSDSSAPDYSDRSAE